MQDSVILFAQIFYSLAYTGIIRFNVWRCNGNRCIMSIVYLQILTTFVLA